MSVNRTTVAALVALAVILAGCSNDKSPTASSTSSSSTSSPPAPASSAPGAPLDQSRCLDIAFAKDNLMVATQADAARRAADTLEKFSPPDPVKAAIEHFVTTLGAKPTDPDLDSNRDQITNWIKQICPNVNP
ncbi:hypothetical protein BN971_00563 [Mycobacterium bohemicum DSM 44277]|uniref:Uncharacterized protein n=1 Tax=Mycobacterium bohemicum DSM 44277 TaxID=1236609 RepID=A0A0U0W5A1_MYCBE|nr:hypothetical protein [Mycobacterium bohemicum]MCV6968448.1 hypothetical protein [Mycobacterium bohemicum]CPR05338.1 hypothetical protein BN971_00563 [Mycobacterium bohemicum DSM 44277]